MKKLLDLTNSPNPNIFSKALGAIANLCVHEEIHVCLAAADSNLPLRPGTEILYRYEKLIDRFLGKFLSFIPVLSTEIYR